MRDLIEKLEAATEGSRELDVAITKALFPKLEQRHASFYIDDIHISIQPYTTSLDAAYTLVPDGWGWTINHDAIAAVYAPEIEGDDDLADWGGAPNGTPAIALCIAVLKARARRSVC